MTGDDAAAQQPEEEAPVIDPGLAEADDLARAVAVGPGEPGARGGTDGPPETNGTNRQSTPSAGDGPALDGGAVADARRAGGTAATSPGDASLLDLVDRLTAVLERSDLAELEVAAGATTIILRSPAAVAVPIQGPAVGAGVAGALESAHTDGPYAAAAAAASPPAAAPDRPSVKAPLTGIYYGAPSPGATPYVAVGNHVSAGQIIGLIEAMKLFNEIKSDLSGRVVRICAESGALVKARQPLIEVEAV
jgi:acetyl-CoA carboxylase biotin carboxyl carrier protein